jgi:hypothetical protein
MTLRTDPRFRIPPLTKQIRVDNSPWTPTVQKAAKPVLLLVLQLLVMLLVLQLLVLRL